MISEKIVVVEGNITIQQVDAIVNAANTTLLGGEEWMGQSIGLLGLGCSRNAGRWEVAPRARQR